MCKFATRPRAEAVAPVTIQEESKPVGPSIDADAIRKQLANLARDKGDAHKVFESVLSGTQGNSLEYERAKVRTTQAGEVRQFADGRHSSDYNQSADGRARFDFSETQDVVSHTERTVHTTRGILGRQRQHVVEHEVQTLVSEKVRFDFNLSEQLDIKVGQNDTAFVNAELQTGHKEINLTQRDGQGSLALVLGKDQTLKEISFDPERSCAIIVTDQATFTILGVNNPEGLVIGREGSGNNQAGFVSVASVASEVANGRREIFESDRKAFEQAAGRATEVSGGTLSSHTEDLRIHHQILRTVFL